MSDLGNLFELLHGAAQRLRSVRMVVQTREDTVAGAAARETLMAQHARGRVYAIGTVDASDEPTTRMWETRFWVAKPDRVRYEERGGRHELELRIHRGDVWWRYDPLNGAFTNQDNPKAARTQGGVGRFDEWLDPIELMASHDFVVLGSDTVAGRAVLTARATPTHRRRHEFPAWMPSGDALQIAIDTEFGVLLREHVSFQGQSVRRSQAVEVEFNWPIDPGVFVFDPPEGEEILSISDRHPEMQSGTVAEIATRVSFPVWVATGLDRSWSVHATWTGAFTARRKQFPESVHLHYHRDDAAEKFALAEHALPRREGEGIPPGSWLPTETVERDGRSYQIQRTPPEWHRGQVRILTERDGAAINLTSETLSWERALDLTAGLRRADPEVPHA